MTDERLLELEEEERARREIRARLDRESGTDFDRRTAAIISIFIPGGGHAYKGQPFNGLAWFAVVVCGYLAFIAPGLLLHLVCIFTSTLPTRPKRAARRVEEDPAMFRARMVVAAIFIILTAAAVWKSSALHPAQQPPHVQASPSP